MDIIISTFHAKYFVDIILSTFVDNIYTGNQQDSPMWITTTLYQNYKELLPAVLSGG